MNIEQFLSEQPIDKLIHQYFSLQTLSNSQKIKNQQSLLINSIVLYIASHRNYMFKQLYQECQYQLQVNNQDRDAVNKLCKLISGVLNKANYIIRNVQLEFFIGTVIEFLMSKIFVTVCSADCIRCLWALVNAYSITHPFEATQIKQQKKKSSCCSSKKQSASSPKQTGCCSSNSTSTKKQSCCGGSKPKQPQIIEKKQQNCCGKSKNGSECCGSNKCSEKSTKKVSECCKTDNNIKIEVQTVKLQIPQLINNHQKICETLLSKLLKTFKLHIKAYPFKVRKDIFKIMQYVFRFIKYSQTYLAVKLGKSEYSSQPTPLLTNLSITKQQLIQLTIKNLTDEKDPRNMQLIFQIYLLIIELFPSQITIFHYNKQIFENIEVYYPLSMQGDNQGFQIDLQDQFQQKDLIKLLDQCLLQQIFKDQVREMLIQKMLAPPIHEYVSLYIKYINKFNPNFRRTLSNHGNLNKTQTKQQQIHKFSVLTLNLLNRLCQQEYLQQNYGSQAHNHQCGDSGCSTKPKSNNCSAQFSIAQLISTIIQNVFMSSSTYPYLVYSQSYEQKYIEFLNNLIVSKLFNHQENNKHAGTIIEIVKTILKSNNGTSSSASSCSSSGGNKSCGSEQSKTTLLIYGQRISYQQILINFSIFKFMQFWSGKGDIAFKIGILIMALNKKLQNVSIQAFKSQNTSSSDIHSQNMLQHLLITLGNVYQTHKSSDQIKIMVLKVLMIIKSIFKKWSFNQQEQTKNMNKIRKINNSIIFKDCIKIGKLLSSSLFNKTSQIVQQSKQVNEFSKSQQPIIKSYIDYIMEMYLGFVSEIEIIRSQIQEMIENVLNFNIRFSEQKINLEQQIKRQKYFDVKLYAVIRFLSLRSTLSINNYNESSNQINELIISIWFLNNPQINKKIVNLLKYYTYQSVLSIINLIMNNFQQTVDNKLNLSKYLKQQNGSFFINISLIGNVVSQKFYDFHSVQLQSNQCNYEKLLEDDIQKIKNNNKQQMKQIGEQNEVNLAEIIIWYITSKIWKKQYSSTSIQSTTTQRILSSKIQRNLSILKNNQQNSITNQITYLLSQRLNSIISLAKSSTDLSKFSQLFISSQLQSTLLYVKYLKLNNKQKQVKFNSRIAELYDNGMIQYFWNRLLSAITYQQENIVSQSVKNQLVDIIKYLPEKMLVLHSEKILPIIVYSTITEHKENNKIVEENKEHKIVKTDQFDYSKTQLIGKISNSLPQQSIILYVLPFCLQFLNLSARACQKNTSLSLTNIQESQQITTLLDINRIFNLLILKSQQKVSDNTKNIKYQKLKKFLFENHKKQISQYLNRLIYHKKRVIRQSSRNLLMYFQ